MRCKGRFTNDRTCDLCKAALTQTYIDCKGEYQSAAKAEQRLQRIKARCGYKTRCYDEYTPFDGCSRNGNGSGRHADDCKPSEKCPGGTNETQ